jgi:hypothetical protein
MGLDNGICIKRNEKSMNIYDKIKRFEDDYDKDHRYDFEVAYWRKCWNVRNLILRLLPIGESEWEFPITREDVSKIIDTLNSLNAETWDEDMSIWTWDEQEPHMQRYINNLEYLYELIENHDLDVYFYDSY